MPTFNGASFAEQGTLSNRVSGQAVGQYVRIAGGGEIWQGPATPQRDQTISFPAQGTEAQYDACYAQLGEQGTLAWGIGGTSLTGRTATARLLRVSDPQRLKQGNVVKWSMDFKIL